MKVKFSANSEQFQNITTIRDTLLPKLISGEIRLKKADQLFDAVALYKFIHLIITCL
ncbi:hypothetical protein PCC6912_05780 [Chlorogloeopsis fritschii PCC 6912]|uniref:Type I restriction modification DNA specificity domain-containing protein n=1 Tax=Chlorogloeopsis fritschii PCC 6912 TaxID=211165 RepID=A0A3S0Y0T6_CHLFR|nr:hypothetical protein PCC6912_05780 [Chlorogloeopsis fritschii PCC 6912]